MYARLEKKNRKSKKNSFYGALRSSGIFIFSLGVRFLSIMLNAKLSRTFEKTLLHLVAMSLVILHRHEEFLKVDKAPVVWSRVSETALPRGNIIGRLFVKT